MRLPSRIEFPEDFAKLIAHTALVAQDSAFSLARELFAIRSSSTHRSIESRFEAREWDYTESLSIALKVLRDVDARRTLDLTIALLDEALQQSGRYNEEDEEDDGCTRWRSAIEDHEQNELSDGIPATLIVAVRDSAIFVIHKSVVKTEEIIMRFLAMKHKVYHRIAIHLTCLSDSSNSSLSQSILLNRVYFYDSPLHHEYRELLRKHFNYIDPSAKETILQWIKEGPEWICKCSDDKEKRLQRWQRDELSIISIYLQSEWSAKLKEYIAVFGEPHHPEFNNYFSRGWVGSTSPVKLSDFKLRNPKQVIKYLREWQPESGQGEPSPEGLASDFQIIVSEKAGEWSEYSNNFRSLEPTYIRAFIQGLRDGIRRNVSINWTAVLDLCLWIVQQPRGEQVEEYNLNRDHHWGRSRKAIIDLIASGIQNGIQFELRKQLWSIIELITDDPEPTTEQDIRRAKGKRDYYNHTINSVRGMAIEVVIRYALWVHDCLEGQQENEPIKDFCKITEAEKILDKHLDTAIEKSPAVRAAYGRWLPWLVKLNKPWVKQKIQALFPKQDEQQILRDCVWSTYLVFNSVYKETTDVLIGEYEYAVTHLQRSEEDLSQFDPEAALAQHLMVLYWQGKFDLNGSDNIIQQFFQKADDRLRSQAIQFIGQAMRNTKDEIKKDVIQRIVALWEWRRSEYEITIPSGRFKELCNFGWLFISGKFEPSWVLKQLIYVTNRENRIEPESEVMETLASLSHVYSFETVQCLHSLVKHPVYFLDVWLWEESALKVLSSAESGESSVAKDIAREIRSILISRGFMQFRKIT